MRTAGGSRGRGVGPDARPRDDPGAGRVGSGSIRPLSLSNRTALRRVEPFGRWDGVTH